MKKIMLVVLIGMSFFLASCDLVGGELGELVDDLVEKFLPELELVGDLDVSIGLNEEYIDPGVSIIGDFDLEVKTSSNLDITQYGIYYIDYTVEFEDTVVEIRRTVRVVPKPELEFNLEYELVATDPFSLTFSVSIDDEDGKLIDGVVEFFDADDNIIEKREFTNGKTTLIFDGLENQKYYYISLYGTYMYEDVLYTLTGYTVGGITTDLDASNLPSIELIGEPVITIGLGEEYIEYGVNVINDVGIEVETKTDLDVNVPGTYIVEYTFIFNQIKIHTERTVIVLEEDEASPEFNVNIEVVENGGYSLGFTVSIDDEDQLIETLRGTLYLGDSQVSSIAYVDNTTVMTFDNLLDDTLYNFVLEGTYLVDGNSVSIGDYQLEVATNPVASFVMFMLNGDAEMEVELNSTFEDPGAYVAGAPETVVNVLSNLDTSAAGLYEIRYTATINGSVQELLRKVTVVEPVTGTLETTVTLDEATFSSLTFTVNYSDPNDELLYEYAVLYQGDEEGERFNIIEGENILVFEELLPNTSYILLVNGMFLNNNTNSFDGKRCAELIVTTLDDAGPVISLEYSEVLIRDVDFTINLIAGQNEITEIEANLYYVYKDYDPYKEVTWALVDGENSVQFDMLMNETDYVLVVEYTYYSFDKEVYIESELVLLEFTTLAPPKPVLKNFTCGLGEDYIICDAEWDELENFANVWLSAKAYKDGEFVSYAEFTDDGTSLFIEGLSPGKSYELKVFADFIVIETGERYGSYIYITDFNTVPVGSEPTTHTKNN